MKKIILLLLIISSTVTLNACQNDAVCVDKIADYECQCPDGWEGDFCDIDMVFIILCIPIFDFWYSATMVIRILLVANYIDSFGH